MTATITAKMASGTPLVRTVVPMMIIKDWPKSEEYNSPKNKAIPNMTPIVLVMLPIKAASPKLFVFLIARAVKVPVKMRGTKQIIRLKKLPDISPKL